MKSKKDVGVLINELKSDKNLNESDIANKLGISREHFSRSKKKDPDELYDRIYTVFAKDLGMQQTTVGGKRPTYDQAVNKVLIREMAKLKSIIEKTDFDSALKDLDDKIELVMS